MENSNLEKTKWSDVDFEYLDWHDCKVYGIAFFDKKLELAFDIDYILEWVSGDKLNSSYKFWVSPATLIFKNVYDININLDTLDFQIDEITRSSPTVPKNIVNINEAIEYEWQIETTNGTIAFKAVGFEQYARRKPIFLDSQTIDQAERGGVSFNIYFHS
jgi:hypothetical protein